MNTTVWLISFTGSDGVKVQKVHSHNCIADFRTIDPNAIAQEIDCAAVAELIEAAKLATEEKYHDGASSREACDRLVAALANIGPQS